MHVAIEDDIRLGLQQQGLVYLPHAVKDLVGASAGHSRHTNTTRSVPGCIRMACAASWHNQQSAHCVVLHCTEHRVSQAWICGRVLATANAVLGAGQTQYRTSGTHASELYQGTWKFTMSQGVRDLSTATRRCLSHGSWASSGPPNVTLGWKEVSMIWGRGWGAHNRTVQYNAVHSIRNQYGAVQGCTMQYKAVTVSN